MTAYISERDGGNKRRAGGGGGEGRGPPEMGEAVRGQRGLTRARQIQRERVVLVGNGGEEKQGR